MDEFDKPRLELLAKLAEQLASLQRECSELRRELDEHIKVQQEQLTQLAALKRSMTSYAASVMISARRWKNN
jgi:chromosome segregation ATPase